MGYDPITSTIARNETLKELKNSGCIGYTENNLGQINWDGLTNGVCIPGEAIEARGNFYRISDITPHPDQISSIYVRSAGTTYHATNLHRVMEGIACLLFGSYRTVDDQLLVIVLYEPLSDEITPGVYALNNYVEWLDDVDYVEKITGYLYETVIPIDQKFIPSLDYLTLNGADGKQYKVTVNESGVLTATAMED